MSTQPTHSPMTPTTPIVHCDTMQQVRTHIDALDERIVALICERSGYVAQAARIKQHADQIVDVERIEYIVQKVSSQATAQDAPASVLAATYRTMIAAFIDFERSQFNQLHACAAKDKS
jgi:isochorismate pyruvate lyase